jgi:hypothetical protein
MKTWKIVAMVGLVVAFTAAAQAESTDNKLTANKLSANKLSANKLSANRLSANRLSANKLAGNKLAGNKLFAHGVASSLPGEGTAADIVAIELPNGVRLAR